LRNQLKEKHKPLNILNLDKLVDFITRFVELKLELYELKVKEQLVVIISSFATLALIISFGLFMIFFGSLALGFYLNGVLESRFLGFLIVGSIYFVICIILVLFKDKIITNHLFQALFSDSLTINDDEQDSSK
jgi:hypothetical protein